MRKAGTWALLQRLILYRTGEQRDPGGEAAPSHHLGGAEPHDSPRSPRSGGSWCWGKPGAFLAAPSTGIMCPGASGASGQCFQHREQTSQHLVVALPGPPVVPASSVCSLRWK